MEPDALFRILLWSTLIHYSVLLLWFGWFVFARHWMQGLHNRWFNLSPDSFEIIQYAGMGLYKLLIFVFGLVPPIAITIST